MQVLEEFPEYPKLREDIITPALSSLRAGSERTLRSRLAAAAAAPAVAAGSAALTPLERGKASLLAAEHS